MGGAARWPGLAWPGLAWHLCRPVLRCHVLGGFARGNRHPALPASRGGAEKPAHTRRQQPDTRVLPRTVLPQAVDPVGREIALRRGANILMPILTPTKYREHYTLYEGKPCITDTADECQKVRP